MAWMRQRKIETKDDSASQKEESKEDDAPPPLPYMEGAGYLKLKGIPFFATKEDVLEFLEAFRPSSSEHIHYEKSSLETGVLGATGEAFVMCDSMQRAKEAAEIYDTCKIRFIYFKNIYI